MLSVHFPFVFITFFSVGYGIRPALDEEFPFQVSVKSEDNIQLCGGAIITPKWILTAADCLMIHNSVVVGYGSANANIPIQTVKSRKIIRQKQMNPSKKDSLALIELEEEVKFSKTAKQAKLPTDKVDLRNTTKLSGWKSDGVASSSLFVSDSYSVILDTCTSPTGYPVQLDIDNFCGIDEKSSNELVNPGSIVSKKAVLLGLLAKPPVSPLSPVIFVRISKHDQWIKDTLGSDAQYIHWTDTLPKSSAYSNSAMSLIVMGISTLFLRFI